MRSTVSLFGNLILNTSLESATARKVTEQYFSFALKFITDESQAKKKASECIFLVVGIFFLCGDTLLVSCHIAELADKGVVSLDLIGSGSSHKPGEGNLCIRDFHGEFVDTEGFLL